jgi:hypothetical protein
LGQAISAALTFLVVIVAVALNARESKWTWVIFQTPIQVGESIILAFIIFFCSKKKPSYQQHGSGSQERINATLQLEEPQTTTSSSYNTESA